MSADKDSSSLSSELSEDSVFGADTSPSHSSHCSLEVERPRQPVSLRGRVHLYPCTSPVDAIKPCTQNTIGYEGIGVNQVLQNAILDRT